MTNSEVPMQFDSEIIKVPKSTFVDRVLKIAIMVSLLASVIAILATGWHIELH